jgi:hypothetical protein
VVNDEISSVLIILDPLIKVINISVKLDWFKKGPRENGTLMDVPTELKQGFIERSIITSTQNNYFLPSMLYGTTSTAQIIHSKSSQPIPTTGIHCENPTCSMQSYLQNIMAGRRRAPSLAARVCGGCLRSERKWSRASHI